jgi:hypothetical protein
MNVINPRAGGTVRPFTKVAIAPGKSSFILPPPLSANQPIERRAGLETPIEEDILSLCGLP